ncbi:MAG: ATP-binding protein [Kofleriaceae bacterium]|nr:ATP-binding protein [Kofleriaceae bacterium]
MRLTFRAKLITMVAIDALALLALIVSNALIDRHVDEQLAEIRERSLPRIGLTERLEASFERLTRSFQDAVAAAEPELIRESARYHQELLAQLDTAAYVVTPADQVHLRQSLAAYVETATAVAEGLIAGAGGEEQVAIMQRLQARQSDVLALLRRVSSFDEAELDSAFASIASVRRTGARTGLVVSAGCLVIILGLSIWIGRDLVRRVALVVDGLQRFGAGQFSPPIPPAGEDELGAVARCANDMAAGLQRLDAETRALLVQTQHQAAELRAANRELDAFAYSVSHDLKAPLRAIDGFSEILVRDLGPRLDDKAREHLGRVRKASQRMGALIEDLLLLSRVSRAELRRDRVDLSALAADTISELRRRDPDREVEVQIASGLVTHGDARLLRIVLENLLGNSWKFTRRAAQPRITLGRMVREGRETFFVTDNGAGFDMTYVDKLFAPFQRLHSSDEFEGSGIGLATVQRVIARHGGRVAAESEVGKGTTLYFTIDEVAHEA